MNTSAGQSTLLGDSVVLLRKGKGRQMTAEKEFALCWRIRFSSFRAEIVFHDICSIAVAAASFFFPTSSEFWSSTSEWTVFSFLVQFLSGLSGELVEQRVHVTASDSSLIGCKRIVFACRVTWLRAKVAA